MENENVWSVKEKKKEEGKRKRRKILEKENVWSVEEKEKEEIFKDGKYFVCGGEEEQRKRKETWMEKGKEGKYFAH